MYSSHKKFYTDPAEACVFQDVSHDHMERDHDEPYEPECDDGQPDEAQEWYDFDPDC